MPDTLTIITALAHPAVRHLVEPEASLASLGLDAIDRTYTLPIEIEERLGIFPPDREIERWQTVRCVMDTVEGMTGYGPNHPDYPDAPRDWDGGPYLCRDGSMYHMRGYGWQHGLGCWSATADWDRVGYTSKSQHKEPSE